jgi:hypothetical protein
VMSAIIVTTAGLFLFESLHHEPDPDPVPAVYSDSAWNGTYDQTTHDYRYMPADSAHIPIVFWDSTLKIGYTDHLTFSLQWRPLSRDGQISGPITTKWRAIDNHGDSCTVEIIDNADGTDRFGIYWPTKAYLYHLPADAVQQMTRNQLHLMQSKQYRK